MATKLTGREKIEIDNGFAAMPAYITTGDIADLVIERMQLEGTDLEGQPAAQATEGDFDANLRPETPAEDVAPHTLTQTQPMQPLVSNTEQSKVVQPQRGATDAEKTALAALGLPVTTHIGEINMTLPMSAQIPAAAGDEGQDLADGTQVADDGVAQIPADGLHKQDITSSGRTVAPPTDVPGPAPDKEGDEGDGGKDEGGENDAGMAGTTQKDRDDADQAALDDQKPGAAGTAQDTRPVNEDGTVRSADGTPETPADGLHKVDQADNEESTHGLAGVAEGSPMTGTTAGTAQAEAEPVHEEEDDEHETHA